MARVSVQHRRTPNNILDSMVLQPTNNIRNHKNVDDQRNTQRQLRTIPRVLETQKIRERTRSNRNR